MRKRKESKAKKGVAEALLRDTQGAVAGKNLRCLRRRKLNTMADGRAGTV